MSLRALAVLVLSVAVGGCGAASAPDAAVSDVGAVSDDVASAEHDAAAAASCDLEAQTGCAPDEKCTLLASDRGNVRGCVPVRGSVEDGAACERTTEGFGHDDCAAGSTCTFIGVLPPSLGGARRCRALCTSDAACGPGERCALLTTEAPLAGFCGPTCAPFGSDCVAPLECTRLWPAVETSPPGFLTCRAPGALARDAACDPVAEDCAPGLVCYGAFGVTPRCARPCDAEHACEDGGCTVLDDASGFGVCL